MTTLETIIEKHLKPRNKFIYGFAHIDGLLNKEFDEFSYGVSIGERLDDRIVDSIKDGPTIEYYIHYKEINNELDQIADNICKELETNKIKCLKIVPTVSSASEEFKPYLQTLRYNISHKMIATRAGLGWIGKTDLFISNDYGARVRLVSILIDKPVKNIKRQIDKSRCGNCRICVDKCPAQAATGALWDINIDRDIFFNAQKCKEKCRELTRLYLSKDSLICGICVAVCPIGQNKKINDKITSPNSRYSA